MRYKNRIMKAYLIILSIVAALLLAGCTKSSISADGTAESAQAYFEEYMEAKKTEKSADKLLSYLYFENKWVCVKLRFLRDFDTRYNEGDNL